MKKWIWAFMLLMLLWGGGVQAEVYEIKVKSTGFYTEEHRHINSKHPLVIPEGEIVTLHFKWSEDFGTMAYGDTHKITLINTTTEEVYETSPIWWGSRSAFIAIGSGEEGTIHRGYCVVDCLGMSNLSSLFILTGGPK